MYIPRELICFILGFIAFPILIGCVYQIKQYVKGGKNKNG